LLDFGIARAPMAPGAAPSFATAPGVLFGTPGYMSPEQAGVSPRVDRYCDLWALSTVAYELLTGELPVAGATPVELLINLREGRIVPIEDRMPELPRSVGAFFQKAFAARPEDRYASAGELALAFERAPAQPDALDDGDRTQGAAGGAGRTVRMHTLRMEVQAWVSSARSRPHRALGGRAPVAGLVLLAFVVWGAVWRRSETGARPAAPSPPAAVIEPVAAATPIVVPPPTPDDRARASDVPPPVPDHTEAPVARPARRPAAPTAPAEHAPAQAAPPAKPNCTTPFWFDASGTKRWKTECL
jgi:hypothetical protein